MLERLAWAAGVSPLESDEWCWGELLAAAEGMALRERRQGQLLAVASMRQAELTARALGGGRLPEVWEAFPFWTEEEIRAQRVEKYRRIMERYAAGGSAASSGEKGKGA